MQKSQMTILIVDDMPANIKILASVLRKDYHISVATNGEDALRIARSENPPDLVLLDIVMPELDGYEVCSRLKADRQTRQIPVIFITSLDHDGDDAKGLATGAVDIITKPFSMPIVKARIQAQLELRQLREKVARLESRLCQAPSKAESSS